MVSELAFFHAWPTFSRACYPLQQNGFDFPSLALASPSSSDQASPAASAESSGWAESKQSGWNTNAEEVLMSLLVFLGGNTTAVFLTPFAYTYDESGSVLILITDWIRLYFQEPYFCIWRDTIPDVEVVTAFLRKETAKIGFDEESLIEKASYYMPYLRGGTCYALCMHDWLMPMQQAWKRRGKGCLLFDSIPPVFVPPLGWYLSPTILFAEYPSPRSEDEGKVMQYPGMELTEARRMVPPFVQAFNFIQHCVFETRFMRDEEDQRHVGLCWSVLNVLEPSLDMN